MDQKKIGPQFDMGDVTILADGTRVYSVYVNGRAPLNGGGAAGVPLGTRLGRVWQTSAGWVGSPVRRDGESDSWADEVARSVRNFARRKDACIFLWGWMMGEGHRASQAQRARILGRPEPRFVARPADPAAFEQVRSSAG